MVDTLYRLAWLFLAFALFYAAGQVHDAPVFRWICIVLGSLVGVRSIMLLTLRSWRKTVALNQISDQLSARVSEGKESA